MIATVAPLDPMHLDALKLALLAACAPDHTELYRIHGELEHWLNRSLATAELESALAELASQGLMGVYAHGGALGWVTASGAMTSERIAFVTTEAGHALVASHWEEFFPE